MPSPSRPRYALQLANGQTHQIEWLKSSRSRHIRVTVTPKGIRVSSPPRVSWSMVERFLQEQQGWLSSQIEKLQTTGQQHLLYLGKEFRLQLGEHTAGQDRVRLESGSGGPICFVAPIQKTIESTESTLNRWLRSQAAEQLTPLFVQSRNRMQISADTLKWREASSRWGSCAATGAIMLNWRLIHAPLEVARYVIIHELAHRKHMDHSHRFWNLVEQYDPAYKLHRGWLKRNGHRCRLPSLVQLV